MASPEQILRFAWWNAQDFAHYDDTRAGEDRWPLDPAEYEAKCDRVEQALREVFATGQPDLFALAEVTRQAATTLRDRLFPGYELFSLDQLAEAELQVAVLFRPAIGFELRVPLAAPNLPRGTRAMAVVDHLSAGNRIRFFACHWTARFQERSKHHRSDLARCLSGAVYRFLHEEPSGSESRHVVIVGDLNEEPFGEVLVDRLYASRDRAPSRRQPHYTDRDTQRVRLYNCSWRLLGERRAHDGSTSVADTAGTHYWQEERSWQTLDHVIVSGSLLSDAAPFLDESRLEVVATPSFLTQGGKPAKFAWNNGKPSGLSDHLPLVGQVVLRGEGSNA